MKRKRRRKRRSPAIQPTAADVQTLESRALLAGVITVAMTPAPNTWYGDRFDLTITGDGNDNSFVLEKNANGQVSVSGADSTQVLLNGSTATSHNLGSISFRNINIDTGPGRDRVTLRNLDQAKNNTATLDSLSIELGRGRRDYAEIISTRVRGGTTVTGGKGRKSVFLSGTETGDLDIDFRGKVRDLIRLENTQVNGDVDIQQGRSSGRFRIVDSYFRGKINIRGEWKLES